MVVFSWPSSTVRSDRIVSPVMPKLILSRNSEPGLISGDRFANKFRICASSRVRTQRFRHRVKRSVIDLYACDIVSFVETNVPVVLCVSQRSVRDRHRDSNPLAGTGFSNDARLVVAVVCGIILHPQFPGSAVEISDFENKRVYRGRHSSLVNPKIQIFGCGYIYALPSRFGQDNRIWFVVRVSIPAPSHIERIRGGIIRERRRWDCCLHTA